jgi:hypothetical protein
MFRNVPEFYLPEKTATLPKSPRKQVVQQNAEENPAETIRRGFSWRYRGGVLFSLFLNLPCLRMERGVVPK